MLKKLNIYFCLIILLISSFANTALGQIENLQHRNYARELVNKEATKLQSIAFSEPFSTAMVHKREIDDAINGEKDFFNLDLSFNRQVLNDKNDVLKLSIPRANSPSINLLLKKVEFISPSIKVPTPYGEKKGIYDWGAFYWGTIEDDETSFASISVFGNEILGIIVTQGNTYTLNKMKNSDEYILYQEKDLVEQTDFVCTTEIDVEKLMQQRDETKKKIQAGNINPDNCARVHFWANNSLYEEFNQDATALSNYLTGMFSVATLVYANEHVNVILNHITISDSNGIPIVGSATRVGDFIMFADFATGGGGGGAGGPICGGGGALYIGSGYAGVPTLGEGIGTLIHEMGHVFGSPHTDLCFWNGNNTQIDDCGTTDLSAPPSCFDPYNTVYPNGAGSIMSYCGYDINYGLGPQPSDLIRYNIYASDCLSPCGLDCIDGNANNTCDADECYPNAIVCLANIADRGYARWACDAELAPGEFVRFNPIVPQGGSWFWTYPNGIINNNKEISVTQAGTYIFTYDDGTCIYTKNMTVTINPCLPNPIVCYSAANNDALEEICYVGLPTGSTATLSPQGANGNWSWTGPNNYTNNNREIVVSTPGDYNVSLSDGGCTHEESFGVVQCLDNPLTPGYYTPASGYSTGNVVTIAPNEFARFTPNLPQIDNGSFLPTWTWIGPEGYLMDIKDVYVVHPGKYTVTLQVGPCYYSLDYELIVTPESGCDKIKSGVYFIEFTDTNQRIEANADGIQFAKRDPTNNENQKWEIEYLEEDIYTIKSVVSGKYIEADKGRCHTFAETYTVDGYQGQEHRKWKILEIENKIFFFPLHCLPYALDRGQSEYMFIYDFEPANLNAQFRLIPTSTASGYTGSGMNCEDGDPCTRGETYDSNCNCTGGTVQPDNDNNGLPDVCDIGLNSPYYIESVVSGQRLQSQCENTDALMKDPLQEDAQKWEVTYAGNNLYTIKNLSSDNYLEVPSAACGNSANVSTSVTNVSPNQQWFIEKIDGDYFLRPAHCPSHAMDRGGSNSASATIFEYNTNNANQKFRLIHATANSNLVEETNSCDDGNPNTVFDKYDAGCNCTGIQLIDCGNSGPTNICQYSANGSNFEVGCDILLCEGDYLQYTFFGCDANLTLRLTGPNGFSTFSEDDCGSINVSDFMTPNMSGIYTSSLINNTTGCVTSNTVNITVNGIGDTCDDGNPQTTNDRIDANCICSGTEVDCSVAGPVNQCQYTTNSINNYITTCDIVVAEGEQLTYTFFGCDANLALNLSGPNGFNQNSIGECGEILVSDSITPDMTGTYTALLTDNTTGCSTSQTVTIEVMPCIDVQLQVWLEGAHDLNTNQMTANLQSRGLLPGQTPVSPLTTPTPAGQPYQIAPWNYTGTEGIGWTNTDYTGNETDWILVSFRTGTAKNTEVARTAGLVMKDGIIELTNRCPLPTDVTGLLYIVLEHRNHIGIMTPQPVEIVNGILSYDFRASDSYRDATSFGQKQLPNGEWAMFAGDADQMDYPSFDVNGTDKTEWFDNNGVFDYYLSPDFNLDGDVNGQDKTLWFENNGISSRVPK